MTEVKICGIRNEADLRVVLEVRPETIGIICGPNTLSADAIGPETTKKLFELIPSGIKKQIVSGAAETSELLEMARYVGADTIQAQARLAPEEATELWFQRRDLEIVRVVEVGKPEALGDAREAAVLADAVLLDSPGIKLGGSGKTHDWKLSAKIAAEIRSPSLKVILAGGLSPGNLREAISVVAPDEVDVNSGLDDFHGDKDLKLCQQFMAIARESPSTHLVEHFDRVNA